MIRTANCVPFILSLGTTGISHVNKEYAGNNLTIFVLMEQTQDWQCTYKRKFETHLLKYFVVEKQAWVSSMQCTCAVLSVFFLVLQYFFQFYKKGNIFGKEHIELKVRVLTLSATLTAASLIVRRIQ
jgi:hypothetical protein